jgi:hypothetical protein
VTTAREDGITKLYHYQGSCFKHLRATLTENRIHCSNPQNFNDPWDCRPFFDAASVNDPTQRPKWIRLVKKWAAGLTAEQQENIVHQLGEEWYENTGLLLRTVAGIAPSVDGNNQERYRIFCLSAHANLLLMWAHYAQKHQGVCLEFDATKEKLWRARRVVYRDAMTAINADIMYDKPALLEAVLLTKSREWSYEKEYRLLGRDGAIDPSFALATDGDFLRLPEEAITAVIAGHNADIQGIRKVIQESAPGVALRRAVQRPNEYHLDIIDEGSVGE